MACVPRFSRECSRRILPALLLVLVAAGGCAAPAVSKEFPLRQLLAGQDENLQRCFLDLLRSNKAEQAFLAHLSGWPYGPLPRPFVVELVRTMPGCNGLVYVQVRPDPDEVPGSELELEGLDLRERIWFFFDSLGHLLTWSDNSAGTWLLEDVTGEGIKDLLVCRPKGLGPPGDVDFEDVWAGMFWYTVFVNCHANGTAITFGPGPEAGVYYGFTLIHLQDSSIPLVMTVEYNNPWKDTRFGTGGEREGGGLSENESCRENEESAHCYTVIRSFLRGQPRLILVVAGELRMITDPGGDLVLKKMICAGLDEKYELKYNQIKRKFEVRWPEGHADGADPAIFSAPVPE